MRKQILLLTIILFSCNSNRVSSETGVVGNWKLIQMTGNIINSETTGADMEWQETYQFDTDGTFQKTRDRDGVIKKASGSYDIINDANQTRLELKFDNENDIVGSCTSGTKETMNLESKNIFLGTWNACDGPGLKYQKTD